MKIRFNHLALAVAALAGISTVGAAAPALAQDANFEAQLRAFLERNPELVTQALQRAQANQQQAETQQLTERVRPVATEILADKQIASIGAANGQPIIEFYDYNCGFCKRFHKETATPLLAADSNYRLLLVHTPILGPGSERMAEFAAAANLQGKFARAHEFLMQQSAHSVEEANALKDRLIAEASLDRARFDRALADGSAKRQVEHNTGLSMRAGVQGTPLIFANGQAIPGAIPLTNLQQVLGKN